MLNRRGFITGLVATLAAPAIVRRESIWIPPRKRFLAWDLGGKDETIVRTFDDEGLTLYNGNWTYFIELIEKGRTVFWNDGQTLHMQKVPQGFLPGETLTIRFPDINKL